jgi:hypothetical protein
MMSLESDEIKVGEWVWHSGFERPAYVIEGSPEENYVVLMPMLHWRDGKVDALESKLQVWPAKTNDLCTIKTNPSDLTY